MVYGIHYEGESLHLTLMSYITITLNQFWFVDVSLVKQCTYKYIFYSGDNDPLHMMNLCHSLILKVSEK